MDVKLSVDGKEIALNEFVRKLVAGTVTGAVTSLRGIRENWKEIRIEVSR